MLQTFPAKQKPETLRPWQVEGVFQFIKLRNIKV